jgi:hypothetical protein
MLNVRDSMNCADCRDPAAAVQAHSHDLRHGGRVERQRFLRLPVDGRLPHLEPLAAGA